MKHKTYEFFERKEYSFIKYLIAAYVAFMVLVIIGTVAFGQPQRTPQDALNLRIATEIGQLRIDNATLAVNLETLQAALTQAQERIKELEAKLAQAVKPH